MSDFSMRADIPPNASGEQLFRVAKYQRWVIYSLLANIGIIISTFAIMFGFMGLPPGGIVVFRLVCFGTTIFIILSAFLLAKQFSSVVVAMLSGLAMLIPFVSLIVLLVFNQKATNYLQQNGVKVGFLGVDPNRISNI